MKISKLRIGIFMGGMSLEREVSFNSGRTVCDHIDITKFDVVPIFQTELGALYLLPFKFMHRGKIADFRKRLDTEATQISWDDLSSHIDFCFLAVHGKFAEDGTLQGMLEIQNIPYLGSKIFGSALSMNKVTQKKWMQLHEILTARDIAIAASQIQNIDTQKVLDLIKKQNFSFPCIVKPVSEGSSVGITVVEKPKDLLPAIKTAWQIDPNNHNDIIVEEFVRGMEFSCICLQAQDHSWKTLAVTQIILESGSNFYDYDQKYMPGRASKITPAKCSTKNQDRISKLCESVSKILGFSTISRIDGFLKKDGTIVIIDPNTVSGMGPSSFLFDQAQKAGMSHTDLISTMIESELKHYNIPLPSTTLEKNMTHKKKLRVAVLFGGDSKAEREVSLESGRNVYYKLPPEKYEQIPVFVDKSMKLYKINHELLVKNATCDLVLGLKPEMKLGWSDLPKICDFAFLALHGGKGENGCVQGTLEMLGLPYNGPGVLTSSMCMDKFKTNEFLRQQGFDVPKAGTIGKIQWKGWKQSTKKMAIQLQTIKEHIGLPLILKPVNEGCSALVSKIHSIEELKLKLAEFFENRSCDALLEECIIGAELTVGIIGNEKVKAFVPSRSIATNEILSVEEKFLPGAGENQTPADLPESVIKLIQKTVERIYLAIGAQGYARIDCFYQSVQQSKTQKERVIILEINTLPALTPATCLFHQAAEEDIRPEKLLETFIELGLERRKKVQPKKKPNKSILSSQA